MIYFFTQRAQIKAKKMRMNAYTIKKLNRKLFRKYNDRK